MLIGKFNPFAKAAAKGELPKTSPLHKAAAYDLDILQKLSVAETTLVSWIEDVSNSLPPGWSAAGVSLYELLHVLPSTELLLSIVTKSAFKSHQCHLAVVELHTSWLNRLAFQL